MAIDNNEIDMLPELKKFFVEVTVLFVFGCRLGAIEINPGILLNQNNNKTLIFKSIFIQFQTPTVQPID